MKKYNFVTIVMAIAVIAALIYSYNHVDAWSAAFSAWLLR